MQVTEEEQRLIDANQFQRFGAIESWDGPDRRAVVAAN